jgi:two-component system LytT family sensor kinase
MPVLEAQSWTQSGRHVLEVAVNAMDDVMRRAKVRG